MLPQFGYVRPTSVEEAVRRLAAGPARVHAGGTDLLGCLRDRVLVADAVVSLSGIPELSGIDDAPGGGLRLGALTTIAEIAANPTVRARYGALADAAAVVGSPQLRNQGTIAGNLCQKPRCWYYRGDFDCLRKGGETCFAYQGENQYHCIFGGDACYIVHPSDPAAALVALEAVVRVAGPAGTRSLAVEKLHVPPAVNPQRELFLEPDEIVTKVVLPPPPAGLQSSYRKVRARASWDFALAGVALALVFEGRQIRGARVVLSGVAPVPWRARGTEQVLVGQALDAATIARAARAAVEGAEPLTENAYKVPLVEGLVTEQLEALAASEGRSEG